MVSLSGRKEGTFASTSFLLAFSSYPFHKDDAVHVNRPRNRKAVSPFWRGEIL